jgi:hypothetical protein
VHSEVVVTGGAQLAGTLELLLNFAAVPQLGEEFTILTATGVIGQFSAVTGHQITPTLSLATIYDSDAVRLVAAVPGDANLDGAVTIADLGVLAANWQAGANGTPGLTFAEALSMFDAFEGVTIPEPTLPILTLTALFAITHRRRRPAP